MKKFVLPLFLLALTAAVHAQSMQIIFQPTNPYFFSKDQVWNFSIINSEGSMNSYVEVTIFRSGSFLVFHSQSSLVSLQTGDNQGQQISGRYTTDNYSADATATFFRNTSILPAGNYSLCVSVTNAQKAVVATSCNEFTVNSITLPVLTFPENNATISTVFPMLNWIPVMPQGIPELQYVMELWDNHKYKTCNWCCEFENSRK